MPNLSEMSLCNEAEMKKFTGWGDRTDAQKIDPFLLSSMSKVRNLLGANLTDSYLTTLHLKAKGINSITTANPPVVTTVSAHGYSTGNTVCIDRVDGMIRANGVYRAVVTSATTFELWTVIDTENPVSTPWDGTLWGTHSVRTGITYAMSKPRYDALMLARQLNAYGAYQSALPTLTIIKGDAGAMEPMSGQVQAVKEHGHSRLIAEAASQWAAAANLINRIFCDYHDEFPERKIVNDRHNPNTSNGVRFFTM